MSAATIESVLRNVYLSVMTERLGEAVWLDPETQTDEAVEWVFHTKSRTRVLRLSKEDIATAFVEAGRFARMLDNEVKEVVEGLKR